MAYNPHATTSEDRFPSGIVFFGASSTKPMLDSSSSFIIDEDNNSLALADGYYLGSQSYRQLLHLASDGTATFASGVVIEGNLTVNGDVVTVNTEQILVEDNILTLNSGDYTTPTVNAGIEIFRGTGDIMSLIWNETSDKWTFTDTAGTYDLVGAYLSQELRNKTLDGTYNTFSNIPNDGLSNSSITITAGTGLKTGGTVSLGGTVQVDIDLNDLPVGAIANGDSIAFIDANDSNSTKKESIADIAALFAGDGLTATNSVINVVGGTGITASANSLDIDATLITSQTAVNDFVECGANSVFLFYDPDSPAKLKKIDLDQLADALVFNASSDIMSGIYVGDGTSTVLLQDNDFLYFADSSEIDATLNTATKTFNFALKPNSIANGKLANDDVTVNAGSGLANGGSVALGSSIRVDLDIAGQTELSSAPDAANDYLLIYDASEAALRKINRNNFVSGLGTMTSFTLAGDTGTNQTITNGNTVKIAGGTGLSSVGSNTDTVTINLDNTSVVADTYGDNGTVPVITVDAQGRLTNAGDVEISISSSQITDFTSASETAIFTSANFVDGTALNFTVANGASVSGAVKYDDSTIGVNGSDQLYIKDAGLSSIAGLTTSANQMIYTTASDTYNVTSLTAFGRSLLDDADASAARTTLGVDPAGTDNSTNVTLAGSYDYITIVGQVITRNAIDLATDVTGTLPVSNGGTGATSLDDITSANNKLTVANGTDTVIGGNVTLTVNEGNIVHDNLSGFVANEHIDHSTVSITAGDGLTGGGTIASTRALNVGAGTGITVGADTVGISNGGVDTTQLADGAVTEAKRDRTVVAMTSTGTIATTTDIALASNTITLTLPAGVDGKIVRVKNIGTGTVTVSSSSLIDGAGSKILYYQNESMTFVYYGSGSTWYVI